MNFGIFGGDESIWSFILFFLFMFLYPKIYMSQMIWKLESDLKEVEEYVKQTRQTVYRMLKQKKDKHIKEIVNNFMDFFISFPVDLDPYGIVKKIDHVMEQSDRRFDYVVDKLAPKTFTKEQKKDLKFTLMGALGTNQIYKVLRHYILTIKKTNNLQLAMILQMSMPMLLKMAKSQVKATKAFSMNIPIGDAIGPLYAASIKTKKGTEYAKEVIVSKEKVDGIDVWVMKAEGPGAALGKIGEAVEKAVKKDKINHIITVDAAAKLEGEKTGKVAYGVGVMMGGIGTTRYKIEEVAVKKDIPLDGVVVKMSPEEASIPLKKEIFKSLPELSKVVKDIIKENKNKRILIIGVGNTCGIGNRKQDIKDIDKKLRKVWRKQQKEKEEEEKNKKRWFFKKKDNNTDII